MQRPRIWLIGGPTASGKSALALKLARALDGEIVNADSMQVYAGLEVLSAAPGPADRALAPHHLFGVADPAEPWSAGRWLVAAQTTLAEIAGRGAAAIVVGGTGLYLRALTLGLAPAPAIPRAIREETIALLDCLGEPAFRERLSQYDSEAAQRIAAGDRQRLTRAMEVFLAGGRPLSRLHAATRPPLAADAWRAVALTPPRALLVARAEARLAAMVAGGALEEVRSLVARNLPPGAPAMKALGVATLGAHLAGRLSLEEALARAAAQTRRYIKRQFTWLRGQAAEWPRIEAETPEAQWRALGERFAIR